MPATPSPTISHAFLADNLHHLEECIRKIKHCTDQLDDTQLWWRPRPEMNSIGNLLLHLCGNMTQWIVNGVPQKPDTRIRPQEFAERGPIPKEELLGQLDTVVEQVKQVLAQCTEEQLLQPRRIQAFDETVLSAISHSLHHLSGHTQEIIYVTRLQLGEAYQFSWVPKTAEQGAE